jgi:NADP-dependent 3-hydroxy acid dehydrogenase YdfG
MQVVVPDSLEHSCLLGIASLLRTARKEHSRFNGQLIALHPHCDGGLIVKRLQENQRRASDVLVRYVEDERQIRQWTPLKTPPAAPCPWKDGGVYLVTGGAGGLGLIVANDIARRSRSSTIILAGRSEVSSRIIDAANAIHRLGARVIYEQADISDDAQVHDLVRRVVSDCGRLTGVIHCAGIVDDRSILAKTTSEFENVLRPKVSGLRNLDEATKSLKLDLFVLFSSVSAAFGNPGQADYATANAYMSAFSAYRNQLVANGGRYGRTIAIDWPLWAQGGMDADSGSKEYMRRQYGVAPLPAAEGLSALDACISALVPETCILYGDVPRLLEAVHEGRL